MISVAVRSVLLATQWTVQLSSAATDLSGHQLSCDPFVQHCWICDTTRDWTRLYCAQTPSTVPESCTLLDKIIVIYTQ